MVVLECQRLAAQLGAALYGELLMHRSEYPADSEGYGIGQRTFGAVSTLRAFIDCVGTGGSMTNITDRLERLNIAVRTIAVAVSCSIVFSKPGQAITSPVRERRRAIFGKLLNHGSIDERVQVTETGMFCRPGYGVLIEGSSRGTSYGALEFTAAGKLSETVITTLQTLARNLGSVFGNGPVAERGGINYLPHTGAAGTCGGRQGSAVRDTSSLQIRVCAKLPGDVESLL